MKISDIDLTPQKANLEIFSRTVIELAESDPTLCVVTSDSRGSGKLGPFADKFPEKVVEVGIAEQNLVGVAAGLASAGKTVFAVSPSSFLTARSFEQIKNDVAYSDRPVVLVGISAGVSYGALGSTHHSIHDLAALRAVNNLDIVVPADNFETTEAVKAAAGSGRPTFLRFGKKAMPALYPQGTEFEIGKAITVGTGSDLAFVATGEAVYPALQAAAQLEQNGIGCRVVSMHTVRPLDTQALLDAAGCKAMITVEEHMVHGGLGEACASVLLQAGKSLPFKIIGIPDEYTYTGSQVAIFEHYGITGEGLAEAGRKLVG
jgi:transketolase